MVTKQNKQYQLPLWLSNALPSLRRPAILLEVTENIYSLKIPEPYNKTITLQSSSPDKIFLLAISILQKLNFTAGIEFTSHLQSQLQSMIFPSKASFGRRINEELIKSIGEDTQHYRELAKTDYCRYSKLKCAHEKWQAVNDEYKIDNNFINTFNWLNHHPALWRRSKEIVNDRQISKDILDEALSWSWKTTGLMEEYLIKQVNEITGEVTLRVFAHEKMDFPPTTWSNDNFICAFNCKHANAIEASGDNFEQAVFALAERVANAYDASGVLL